MLRGGKKDIGINAGFTEDDQLNRQIRRRHILIFQCFAMINSRYRLPFQELEVVKSFYNVKSLFESDFFRNKCEYFKLANKYSSKLQSWSDLGIDFRTVKDLKNYFLYCAHDPLRIDEKISISSEIREEVCFGASSIKSWPASKLVALYWRIQQNKGDVIYENITTDVHVKIEQDFDVLDIYAVQIHYCNKIVITNSILKNTRFAKILSAMVAFDLSYHLYHLHTYQTVACVGHAYADRDVSIFDRYVSTKILAQILQFLQPDNSVVKKILDPNAVYWPEESDHKLLFEFGTKLATSIVNCHQPIWRSNNGYQYKCIAWSPDVQPVWKGGYHDKRITWSPDVVNELYSLAQVPIGKDLSSDWSCESLQIHVIGNKNKHYEISGITTTCVNDVLLCE